MCESIIKDMNEFEELQLQYHKRVAHDQLGKYKYSTYSGAISELIANSFDASADKVYISFSENKLGGIESLTIEDNGIGISPETLRERFVIVG
ncbi:ATP-binding region, ATPase-like domain protein, partial [Candidatus Magnetobacterium bavaricum]